MSNIKMLLGEIHRAAQSDDRGMLAALRRGFSEATEQYAWPYIARYCDITDKRQRTIWLTVAAAAATLAPDGLDRSDCGNIGATMRNLALGSGEESGEAALSKFENRFRRLLACDSDEELCRHIKNLIRAASAKGVPVDVEQLFWDIQKWDDVEEPTSKMRWARVYWMDKEPGGGEGAV